MELFLDNLDQEIYLNHNLTRYNILYIDLPIKAMNEEINNCPFILFRCAELDANVRIRLTMFIVQMGEWCVHEVSLYAHFCKFISTFSEHLLLQVNGFLSVLLFICP